MSTNGKINYVFIMFIIVFLALAFLKQVKFT